MANLVVPDRVPPMLRVEPYDCGLMRDQFKNARNAMPKKPLPAAENCER